MVNIASLSCLNLTLSGRRIQLSMPTTVRDIKDAQKYLSSRIKNLEICGGYVIPPHLKKIDPYFQQSNEGFDPYHLNFWISETIEK